MTMRATTFAGAAALALAVAAGITACATPRTPVPGGAQPESTPSGVLVSTQHPVTVIDKGSGAELCLGGVFMSLPPQCGGPGLIGWDWSRHDGEYEEESGVRWGEFIVTGTFDESVGTLTPVDIASGSGYTWPAYEGPDFSSPCPEPAGGWRVLDEATATAASMDEVLQRAASLDGYGASWIDTSLVPRGDPQTPEEEAAETAPQPRLTIVNVRVTGDPATAESELREVWGGMLCISKAARTDAELRAIQDDIFTHIDGLLGAGVNGIDGVVDISVVYDDGALQAELDEQYGEGVVLVTSALTPAG